MLYFYILHSNEIEEEDRLKYNGPSDSLLCILLHTEKVFFMHAFESSIKV
jgi:hypothetical protein